MATVLVLTKTLMPTYSDTSLYQQCNNCLRTLSEQCHNSVTRVSQECHKSVTRVSQECHKSVTRVSRQYLAALAPHPALLGAAEGEGLKIHVCACVCACVCVCSMCSETGVHGPIGVIRLHSLRHQIFPLGNGER
jgi:hypothetical protein